jgi:hypothetical protein
MYEIKRTILPPSETKYPWAKMQVLDHFECPFSELAALKESARRMAQKFYGFNIEIARAGDTLTVWLMNKGQEAIINPKIESRVIEILSGRKVWVTEGVIYNRVKGASREAVKECLNVLLAKGLIYRQKGMHPRRKIEFSSYRIK